MAESIPPKRILVVGGPNLNLFGRRQPEIYGTVTLNQIHQQVTKEAERLGFDCICFQSNHEGAVLDFFHENIDNAQGALLNPAGLTQYSPSLFDALKAMPFPVIEVHLSNLYAREAWRGHSIISAAARGVVQGFGWYGYIVALYGLVGLINEVQPEV